MNKTLTRHERRIISLLLMLWVFLLAFLVPQYAYAYIDPAATTYIIQVITAIIVTIGVSFSIVIYRFRMMITKLWVRLTSGSKKNTQSSPATASDTDTEEDTGISTPYVTLDELGFVSEGASQPPDRAYGFALNDEQELEELAENFAFIQGREQASDTRSVQKSHDTNTFKGKLKGLFEDKRSFKVRLGLSALVSFSLIFTVFVFGPLELFANSRKDMLFELSDFIGGLLLVAFVLFLILTVVLLLLRGKPLDTALSLLTGVLIACYVQALFFNDFLGVLGDNIAWHEHTISIVLNLFVWILIISVVFFIRFASKKAWQTFIVFACSLLIIVPIVSLTSISNKLTAVSEPDERSLVLSDEGILELSNQQNIIVFLLDTLDTTYIDSIREKTPDFFNPLEGFTEYTDNVTRYSFTYPSVAYSLTGYTNDFSTPSEEYFEQIYSEHLFIDDLVDAGWDTKLYLNPSYDFEKTTQLKNRASNLIDTTKLYKDESWYEGLQRSLKLVKELDQLSIFRYAPSGLKSTFWVNPSEISLPPISDTLPNAYGPFYQLEFMNDLDTTGLSANNDSPTFIYYHLLGSHGPHNLSSDGYPSSETTNSIISQTEGCFNIIYKYIDQLKELGIYEDTCIIITGDHGGYDFSGQTLTALFYKPMGNSDEELIESTLPVSDSNLVPTIIEQSGVDSIALAASGLPYSQVTNENTHTREVLVSVETTGTFYVPDFCLNLYLYEILGSAADRANWQLVYQSEENWSYWGGLLDES